jgi:hypothetical protein
MKKLIFSGVLVGSLGMNLYFLNSEIIVQNDLDSDLIEIEIDDKISMTQSAIQKPKITINNNKKQIGEIRKDFLPEDKSEETEANNRIIEKENYDSQKAQIKYEEEREDWQNLITERLEREAGLEPEQVEKYFSIVDERRKAIDDYLSPLFKNIPEGETLMLGIEERVEMTKIDGIYLDKLKKTLGTEKYNLYRKFRKEFNERDKKEKFFFVEF